MGEQTPRAAPLGEDEVMIGVHRVHLRPPKSIAVALEVLGLMDGSPVHGFGAAIGICWLAGTSSGAPKARLAQFGQSMHRFGGAVVDELMLRGVPQEDLLAAGQVASAVLLRIVPARKEVREAEDFSEPPGGGST